MGSTTNLPPQDWQTTEKPGQFVRPVNFIEAVYYDLIDCTPVDEQGREEMTVSSGIRLEISEPEHFVARANEAWLQLRYQQPDIASYIDRTTAQRIYQIATDKEIEEWLAETFHVISEPISTLELRPALKSLRRTNLYVLLHKNELLIRGPHTTLDGAGTIALWNDLLLLMADPQAVHFGDEFKNLAPGMPTALSLPTPTAEDAERGIQRLIAHASSFPGYGLMSSESSGKPGDTHLVEHRWPAVKTTALIEAAKARGFTPTHVVHAAVIQATKELNQVPAAKKFVSFGVFDYRPLCTPSTQRYHANLYNGGWSIVVDHVDFFTTASQMKDFYQSYKHDRSLFREMAPWARALGNAFKQPLPPGIPAPSDPILSSLGLIDSRIKKEYGNGIKVADFWLAADRLGSQSNIFVSTFNGELRLMYSYNEGFMSSTFMLKFGERVMRILEKELLAGRESELAL